MNRITLILILAIAILVSACTGNTASAPAAQAIPVPVLSISKGKATTYQEYPVMVEGRVNVQIRPQVDGYLETLYVDEGAFVKAGQSIFKIDDHRYREQLNSAVGNLNAAEAALINAQLEVEKLTPLVAEKVVSDYQLKSAKASLKVAEANKKQAEAAVASAKINLGYTLITAPVDGYITRLPKKQGSLVSASDPEPLTTLSDIAVVHAYFSLGESDFLSFRDRYEGNTLNEKIKNLPPVSLVLANGTVYETQGKIDMVDGQFDRTTGAITLRASFPNSKGLLRSGNTGRVRLGMAHDNVILVPQATTVEVQDRVFVYTVDKDNKVARKPITIIGKSGTDYLVSEGLEAGDRIVSKGFENLQEGAVVVPQKAESEMASK
ncbi:efflux RND transporter periplasmic adaptor subunit [Flavobacterium alkalisoli]|uniref:Efflux RND transporter periplasmic adaptor subunit n=1 Tax=Flavobacterium alkalisoli TaxID=2602769 RepID=A0A5B9FY80_9FLAO|nr:efflux RND transporter periplasmic adaptor subunit [Flavobacterium alkalisoli]QEE49687.1 efflux RND transporter periplasmic adaptor subunit [Flavobacterium alkalisoli]